MLVLSLSPAEVLQLVRDERVIKVAVPDCRLSFSVYGRMWDELVSSLLTEKGTYEKENYIPVYVCISDVRYTPGSSFSIRE